MTARRALILLFIGLAILACESEEPELQKGDIVGRVGFAEANFLNWVDSVSNVKVSLLGEDGVIREYITAQNGRYIFEDVPAGLYTILLDQQTPEISLVDASRPEREALLHLGGGPTIAQHLYLVEKPKFEVEIRSHEWNENYLTIRASVGATYGDIFDFWVFLGDEHVASDNFQGQLNTRGLPPQLYGFGMENGETVVRITMFVEKPEEATHVVLYSYAWASASVFGQQSEVRRISP